MKKSGIMMNVEGKERRLVYLSSPDETQEVYSAIHQPCTVQLYHTLRFIAVQTYITNRAMNTFGSPSIGMVSAYYDNTELIDSEADLMRNFNDLCYRDKERVKLATTIGTHGLYRYGRNPQ